MNQREALSFLGIEDDDLQDAYEQILFEHKQFFQHKAIIPKVFLSRIQKMQKQLGAFSVLGLREKRTPFTDSLPKWNLENVLESHLLFSRLKFDLKTEIHRSESLSDLISSVEKLMKLHENFASLWFLERDFDTNGLTLSNEVDEMLFLQELKAYSKDGNVGFDALKQDAKLPTLLLNEMKRLTLLYKN